MSIRADLEAESVKVEQVEIKRLEPVESKAISLNERGLVDAKDNSELLRYCDALLKSGAAPERFNNALQVFGAVSFVRGLGFPDSAIRQVAIVHGSMMAFGDLPLALCQKSPEFLSIKEQWFDAKYDVISFENKNLTSEVFGSVCFLHREGNEPQSFSFTLDDAKKAGLYPAKSSSQPWAKYTNQMLRYRARSIGLKSLFADSMNGVGVLEYDQNETITDERDVKDIDKKVDLNGL